jgi:hypothetical protein
MICPRYARRRLDRLRQALSLHLSRDERAAVTRVIWLLERFVRLEGTRTLPIYISDSDSEFSTSDEDLVQ